MQLDQVDAIDAEPLERALDLLLRALVVPLSRLRREEKPVRVPLQPRRDPQLGVAVRGGGIDVVEAVLEQHLERGVRLALRDGSERGGTEEQAGALVAGAPEGRFRDHSAPSLITRERPVQLYSSRATLDPKPPVVYSY